jgi:predicted ester cyclase
MPAMRVFSLALVLAGASLSGFGPAVSAAQDSTPEACPATTEEENIALVSRWYEEVYNQGNLYAVDELLSDDFNRFRAGVEFTNEAGNDDDRAFAEMIMSEFPDVQFGIEDIFASDDSVAVRTITTGTHMGPMVDIGNAPATGLPMARNNIAIWRVECGELAEQWIVQDNLGMLLQLGVITEAELADADAPGATPAP